jgi:hypothetical protein
MFTGDSAFYKAAARNAKYIAFAIALPGNALAGHRLERVFARSGKVEAMLRIACGLSCPDSDLRFARQHERAAIFATE